MYIVMISHEYLAVWVLLHSADLLSIRYFQNATTLLGFLKVFRLLRLGRVARKIDKYLEYGASTFFLLMLSFCLVAHWMACIFYLIATKYDNYVYHGWLQVLGRTVGEPYKLRNGTNDVDTTTGPTIPSKYVSALYYTLTSLTTIGFGNIAPNTTAEKLFGCITMLLGGEKMFALSVCTKSVWNPWGGGRLPRKTSLEHAYVQFERLWIGRSQKRAWKI